MLTLPGVGPGITLVPDESDARGKTVRLSDCFITQRTKYV